MSGSIHTQQQTRLCALLRHARRQALLTQEQLAKHLGKPQSYVSNYETGERRLDVVEFLAVAQAIGFDPKAMIAKLEE